MNIANNNLTFASDRQQRKIDRIASLDNSDLETASKVLAYQNYKDSSDKTRALGLGLLLGIPTVDSIASAANLKNAAMSERLGAGLKTLGGYGVIFIAASAFIKLINKGVKNSPATQEFADKNPATFILGSLAGVVGLVMLSAKFLPSTAKYLHEKLLSKTPKLSERINNFGLIQKSKEFYGNLKENTGDFVNRLNGGRIEAALNKVEQIAEKEIKGMKVGSIFKLGTTLTVIGLITKYVSDSAKLKKDAIENFNHLNNLRSQAREIATINDEANTTKELALLEIES